MARIVLTHGAVTKLGDIETYYITRDQNSADRVLSAIFAALARIAQRPLSGRPQLAFEYLGMPELREVVIPFGSSGFVALYRIDRENDAVVILALRHQREEKFGIVDI